MEHPKKWGYLNTRCHLLLPSLEKHRAFHMHKCDNVAVCKDSGEDTSHFIPLCYPGVAIKLMHWEEILKLCLLVHQRSQLLLHLYQSDKDQPLHSTISLKTNLWDWHMSTLSNDANPLPKGGKWENAESLLVGFGIWTNGFSLYLQI